jgi:riboflavin kinase
MDADAISALPAHTAPYPSNSCSGMDGDEKRRLKDEDGKIWPMVMSVGYNPYFKNEKVTAVCHIFYLKSAKGNWLTG